MKNQSIIYRKDRLLEAENNVVLGGYHFIATGVMDYAPRTYTFYLTATEYNYSAGN